jgi:hypothetical protein
MSESPLPWRIGCFAERNPRAAAEIGRANALAARACRALFDTAGTAPESSFLYPVPAPECCGEPGCTEAGTCCAAGCCATCRPDEDDFEMIHGEADAQMDEGQAFAAACRDILTDPDLEDTAGAMQTAREMTARGTLGAYYAPRSPAKPMPDGSKAPAMCPVCGMKACPACGCTCCCCDSAVEQDAADDDSMTM